MWCRRNSHAEQTWNVIVMASASYMAGPLLECPDANSFQRCDSVALPFYAVFAMVGASLRYSLRCLLVPGFSATIQGYIGNLVSPLMPGRHDGLFVGISACIKVDGGRVDMQAILNLEGMFKFKFDFDIAGGLKEKNSGIIQSSLDAAHI